MGVGDVGEMVMGSSVSDWQKRPISVFCTLVAKSMYVMDAYLRSSYDYTAISGPCNC